jgi:predicted dehydrogenase/threonine dehydrogenase-like Zn-dependent dehydrogenase
MKQLLQSAQGGEMRVEDVPAPQAQPGYLVVGNRASLVSAGTERTLVNFANKNLLQKARARPDLVQQTLDKVKRDGLLTTIDAVRTRLDSPLALGYSSAGVVRAVGAGVPDFQIGQPVACAGFGYASHAEIVTVPKNLAVPIPDGATFEDAAFTTLGAIALQGIRQAAPQLGDNVAVIGLGLLGQLTAQMLKANGCRVMGTDLDPTRIALALDLGIDEAVLRETAVATGQQFTAGQGFDAILITADTSSNDPLELAGQLARDKGVVVVVGAVGMQVPRSLYYNKELDLRLSRSYGPGRYDPRYEEQGLDYPYGYVRWTENRNMAAFLQMVSAGQINLQRLITHRFPIEQAQEAYNVITGEAGEPFLGVLLTYADEPDQTTYMPLDTAKKAVPGATIRIGMIGAGSFANSVLLPAMRDTAGLHLRGLCASSGVSSKQSGQRFGFEYVSTDENQLLHDDDIDLIVIATPHHLHARQTIAALEQKKHVFCEKPICISESELQAVADAYDAAEDCHLMVGFNRRFAPLAVKLAEFLSVVQEPLLMQYRINGGYVPLTHWIQDPQQGGGRLVGEVCHFVDFFTFLTGQSPLSVFARVLPNNGRYADDNLVLILNYPDGSVGTITYAANGDKALGKERIEVFGGGSTAVLEDFRHLTLMRNGKKHNHRLRLRQDKGHKGEWQALAQAVQGGQPTPIPFAQILATTLTSFKAIESLRSGQPVSLQISPDM